MFGSGDWDLRDRVCLSTFGCCAKNVHQTADPAAAVHGWVKSAPHFQNMMAAKLTHYGIARNGRFSAVLFGGCL